MGGGTTILMCVFVLTCFIKACHYPRGKIQSSFFFVDVCAREAPSSFNFFFKKVTEQVHLTENSPFFFAEFTHTQSSCRA